MCSKSVGLHALTSCTSLLRSTGFIDGDLIEEMLLLEDAKIAEVGLCAVCRCVFAINKGCVVDQVASKMQMSAEDLVARVEAVARIH